MTKQEFIEKLRFALNGKVPANVIADNIQYYEDYINTEIRKGKSEEEVLAALGDPRLIARTIITTSAQTDTAGTREYGRASESRGSERRRTPVWMWLIFGMLIVVLIFSMVVSLLSFLWPILVPMMIIMAVMGVVKFFRDWMN